jgi:hypothetical protein
MLTSFLRLRLRAKILMVRTETRLEALSRLSQDFPEGRRDHGRIFTRYQMRNPAEIAIPSRVLLKYVGIYVSG